MIRSQILKRKPSSRFRFTLPGSALAYAAPFLACLGAGPAQAASFVTYVSGKGSDTGTCASPANPCRTFQFAVGQTSANGEIKALDPANYSGVEINKSISITGVEGAGIDRGGGPVAITINAGPNDVVNLSHLTLDGLKTAQFGIALNRGGSLTITHCTVRNFTGVGIFVDGGGAPSDVTAVDTMATNNRTGFVAQSRGVLRLAHSAATGNTLGVLVGAFGAKVFSFGDNHIGGNVSDVSGALTPVRTQ
jgi:hypothetical protein